MTHDPTLIDTRPATKVRSSDPQGRERLMAFPAAFAVSGGTYQRLVPRSQGWPGDAEVRSRDQR